MEQVATKIVTKLVSADLISEDESDLYNYGVQVILEKAISYAMIFAVAMIIHRLVEILLFFVEYGARLVPPNRKKQCQNNRHK